MKAGDLFKRVPPRHVWVFLTQRCNLHCDYCFFSNRFGTQVLPFSYYEALLGSLPKGGDYDIVFSGGEPLLEWPLVRRMVLLARKVHPHAELTLQTNCLLLDAARIAFLKKNDVVVEPGIDGDLVVNTSHRRGIEPRQYKVLLDNVRQLLRAGVRMNPTMTVHPGEAGKMLANFSWLVEQGLSTIDVHPAFMAPWTSVTARQFVKGYRSILAMEQRSRRYLVCKGYSTPIGMSFDLVILPDGRVLPNWTYLTFPREVRDRFCVMQLTARGLCFEEGLAAYLKDLGIFFAGKERTYRELSNFNAARALAMDPRVSARRGFRVYESLCRDIQQLDKPLLRRDDLLDPGMAEKGLLNKVNHQGGCRELSK